MSTQPTDDQDGVVYVGRRRLRDRRARAVRVQAGVHARACSTRPAPSFKQQLAKLGPEFFVLAGGYGRAEIWSPDAIVVGPPGVFLIHVVWGRA